MLRAEPPILCRRCKRRIPDLIDIHFVDEVLNNCEPGQSLEVCKERIAFIEKRNKIFCCCRAGDSSLFTSRPQPQDLQWHDKFDGCK